MYNKTYIIVVLIALFGCTNPKSENGNSKGSTKINKEEKQKEIEVYDSSLVALIDQKEIEEIEDINAEDELLRKRIIADTLGDCKKCDIIHVLDIKKNIDDLDYDQVYKFFCTIRYSCYDNAEFGEFSNEMLFLLFEKQTQLAFKVLESETDINLTLICEELSSPIHDGIEVNSIKSIIEKNISNGEIKNKVLQSLQIAIDRYN
jgi:hypothetical protein